MRGLLMRRLLAGFLVMGLFAHAAAFVRHGAMVLGVSTANAAQAAPTSAIAALEADLKTVLCHPGSGGSDPTADIPLRLASDCPICAGLAFAFTLPRPHHIELPVPRSRGVIAFPEVDHRVARIRFLRPASRGPPIAV